MDILGIVGNPQMSVLNRPLQAHTGTGQCRKGANAFHREQCHGQVLQPIEQRTILFPPDVGATGAIGIDGDLCGAAASLTEGFLIRLSDLNPEMNGAGQIFLPERGFILGSHAAPEGQGLACMESEGQQPYHHAFVRFRRMARHCQDMILVVLAVHVGDL